jgi:hypothetical protein
MAIAGLAVAGDNVISASTISEEARAQFRYRFPCQGISVKFIDIDDTDALQDAIDDKTRAIYVESVSSIGLSVTDIKTVSSIAHEAGVPLIVSVTNLSHNQSSSTIPDRLVETTPPEQEATSADRSTTVRTLLSTRPPNGSADQAKPLQAQSSTAASFPGTCMRDDSRI